MKSQWKTILSDASLSNTREAAVPVAPDGNAFAGDEKEDGDVVSKLKERKYRIEKDVVRTDRTVPFFIGTPNDAINPPTPTSPPATMSTTATNATTPTSSIPSPVTSANLIMLRDILMTYTIHNFELGYVQGMNDLLAPILVQMRDEVEAFECFKEFMETMKFNFLRDQSGMRKQLHLLELLIKFLDAPLYSHLGEFLFFFLYSCLTEEIYIFNYIT
jgi:hypothetical protein